MLLARAGFRVAVVERKAFPRRKVCGEYLSATNRPLFAQLGLPVLLEEHGGPPVHRVGLFAGVAKLHSYLPRPTSGDASWGHAIGRDRLDTLLLQRAHVEGARVMQPCNVVAMRREDDHFRCAVQDGPTARTTELVSPIVIAAHGSWETGFLLTQPNKQKPLAADLFGFKARFRATALPVDLMPLLCFPGGYGGMVHSDDGRVSLSFCIRRDELARIRGGRSTAGDEALGHIEDSCLGVREALLHAERDGPWLAAGPIRPGIRLIHERGLYTVGNAAGEAHPVVAEGISMAMQGAWLLTRLLIAWRRTGGRGQPPAGLGADYARQWRRCFAPRLRAASLIAHWAMRPTAVALSLPVLHCFPGLLTWGARFSGKATKVVFA